MWLIFLEAGVALCLLLLIVWSTWPKQSKRVPLRHPPESAARNEAAHDVDEAKKHEQP